jgi:hypothetical protein
MSFIHFVKTLMLYINNTILLLNQGKTGTIVLKTIY